MFSPEQYSQLLFSAIAANPYLHSLYQGLKTFLPDAHWFLMNDQFIRSPFPLANESPFCEIAQKNPQLQESIRQKVLEDPECQINCYSSIVSCCDDYHQGIVRFFLRGQFLGAVGICHIGQEQRGLLEHTIKIIEGYLALLSGSLEDHDDLERVHNLWTETISVVDLHELLERIMRELCTTLSLKKSLILLVNEDGEFYPAYVKDLPSKLLKQRNLEVSRYDYMERISEATDVILHLPEEDPLRQWMYRTLVDIGNPIKGDMQCYAIPFYRRTYLIGMFLTITEPGFEVSPTKESVIRILAVGGAAALDNAMTLERMNQRRKALSTIHVVHRLISSSISTNELLPKIAQLARQLLNARKCSIMLYDRTSEHLQPKVSLGLDSNEVGQKTLEMGEGLPGWVAENYNPILYHPSGNSPSPWKNIGETYPSDSYLAVALFDQDIEGVITVADKQGEFTPGDREILVTFAEQAILAIKNARIHEGERTVTVNALKSIANLIETHDPARKGVTVTACDWAQRIARQMNLNERETLNIIYAALLRDTGMLRSLQATFSIDEHRQKGAELSVKIVQSLGLPEEVSKIVYHAGESWNGHGRPNRLKGGDIPLGSRIIAVANAFASLINKWSRDNQVDRKILERSFKIISRLSHRTFDPDVVNALEQVLHNPSDDVIR